MVETYLYGPFRHGASATMQRADLEFYGINHYRPSFVARIYFNDPEVDADSATEERDSYAGSFAIFGHQRCSGDEGHCDVHPHARRFDDRPSHPLTRAFKRVIVTEALRRCLTTEDLTITVIAASGSDDTPQPDQPLLDFQGMQLTTFN